MKLIIAHSKTKRVIKGDFKICATKGDLIYLAEVILRNINRQDFSYGWIDIHEPIPSIVNSPPEAWDDYVDYEGDIDPSVKEVLRLEHDGMGYANSDNEIPMGLG